MDAFKKRASLDAGNSSTNDNGTVATASTTNGKISKKDKKVPGYCDICQMSDRFKDMALLRCQECGVHVHDRCYGIDETKYGQRNYKLTCWACLAVGTKVKVREKDPFTHKRRVVSQPSRPTKCCLCSIHDGVHAMHPVFDSHGTRGRQILLPPDEETGERKLAWCHTLCALTINSVGPTKGCFYACTSRGFYISDDLEHISDSESVNSELENEAAIDNQHHYVYWGHYERLRGEEVDEWGKKFKLAKSNKWRCSFCGKDDDRTTMLNGREMFSSLRIPLQCTAKNRDEFEKFRQYHRGYEACYKALHAGCAMWGCNEDGEKSIIRRLYFFPGLDHSSKKIERNPVVECYCDLHAKDLFLREPVPGKASLMEYRLQGPFAEVTGSAKKRLIKWRQDHGGPLSAEAVAAANSAEAVRGDKALKKMHATGKTVLPGQGIVKHSSGTATKPSSKRSANTAITLHGETRKKKAKELKKAGEAVAIQTEKHGRLVSSHRASGTNATIGKDGGNNLQRPFAQRLLDNLTKEKEKCLVAGKTFHDSTVTAPLRIQWLNRSAQEGISKENFKASWKEALVILKGRNTKAGEASKEKKKSPEIVRDTNNKASKGSKVAKGGKPGSVDDEFLDDVQFGGVILDRDVSLSESAMAPPRKKPKRPSDSAQNANVIKSGAQKQDSVATSTGFGTASKSSSQTQKIENTCSLQRFSKAWNELVHEMVVEIAEKIDLYKHQATEESEQKVHVIIKKSKNAWKKKVRFSIADFKFFFADVKKELISKCSWLEIEGVKSSQDEAQVSLDESPSTSPRQSKVAMSKNHSVLLKNSQSASTVNPPKVSGDTDKQQRQKTPIDYEDMAIVDLVDMESETNSMESPAEQHHQAREQVQEYISRKTDAPLEPPNRWSHLSYGPYFNRIGFTLEWDTFEEIKE